MKLVPAGSQYFVVESRDGVPIRHYSLRATTGLGILQVATAIIQQWPPSHKVKDGTLDDLAEACKKARETIAHLPFKLEDDQEGEFTIFRTDEFSELVVVGE